MKKGTMFSGEIADVDEKGRGVFTMDEKSFSVPFAIPGDKITAEFQKRSKKKRIAKLVEIASSSENRIEAPCPHAGICGGCLWQQMEYGAQLDLKKMMINRALEKHGHEERISEVFPNPPHEQTARDFRGFYRNRMDYAVGWKGELGLREYGKWNKYLDLKTCLLLDEVTPEILHAVRELMRELKLEPWDNKYHRGNFKYLTIRRGEFTNERMITLLFHDLSKLDHKAKEKITSRLSPFCTTLYLGEQPTNTDIEYAKTLERLHGKTYLREQINGIEYDIHPNSFFQTNSKMAVVLQNKITELIKPAPHQKILDLYCGLGFFSLALAKQGANVTGIELVTESIELAKHNAELNNLSDKTTFTAIPVEQYDWQAKDYHTVIIDPSRAGLHPKVIQKLVNDPVENLIYISCNYRRLAEELSELKQIYALKQIEALDLFPHTPHVEVLVELKRK